VVMWVDGVMGAGGWMTGGEGWKVGKYGGKLGIELRGGEVGPFGGLSIMRC